MSIVTKITGLVYIHGYFDAEQNEMLRLEACSNNQRIRKNYSNKKRRDDPRHKRADSKYHMCQSFERVTLLLFCLVDVVSPFSLL